ncbi:hypothetical protein [Rhizobium sp. P32RR-XVIII]|uniref:hypothetical protein n=1 Tax=Rhizobium sp. P32RR-XVIII TaxID=2726738 RepID=UPI00197F2FAC
MDDLIMGDREFRHRLKIEATELELWIEQGCLALQIAEDQRDFRDAHVCPRAPDLGPDARRR